MIEIWKTFMFFTINSLVITVRDLYEVIPEEYRKRDSLASSGQRSVQEVGQLGYQWPKVSTEEGQLG